jgi:hypothetical protein
MKKRGLTIFSWDFEEFFENPVSRSRKKFDFEPSIAITAPVIFATYYALQHSVTVLGRHPKVTRTREIVDGFASFPDRAPNLKAIIQVITSPALIVCEVIQ